MFKFKKPNFWFYVSLTSFILILLFLVLPSFSIITGSFYSKKNGFSLDGYKYFFTLKYYYESLWNSIYICSLATFFSTLLGLPIAFFMSRTNIRFKKTIDLFIILSLLSPPFIGAYSWIILLGRNGIITKTLGLNFSIYGVSGIVLVFTLKFFPFVYMYVSGALKSMDNSMEEAAQNLGAGFYKKLFTITFPLVMPSITAGALMVFMTSLADFGTPMLLGEGLQVLPTMIYNEYMSEIGGDAQMASTVSVIVVALSTIMLLIQKAVISRKSYKMNALRPPEEIKLNSYTNSLSTLFCIVIAGIAFLPQIVVIITSFLKTKGPLFSNEFSLESYTAIINKLSNNITNTFIYSGIAVLIMLLAGLFLSYTIFKKNSILDPLLDILIMFPYVIPGTVLGIGLILSFNKPLLGGVFPRLTGTATILIISYVIRKLAYTVRSGTAILHQIDPSIEEASINLGVSPLKTFFKITAVMMGPGIISGLLLSLVATINELSSTIVLYSGRTSTIAVQIYSEVLSDSFGTAAALSTILTATSMAAIIVFRKLSKKVSII